MNLDSLSFALAQITNLVSNLTKKNYKSSQTEITTVSDKTRPIRAVYAKRWSTLHLFKIIETHGFEAERHLYRCLFSTIDFNSDNKNAGKDHHQTQFLKENLNVLVSKSNFVSILTFALQLPLQFQEVPQFEYSGLASFQILFYFSSQFPRCQPTFFQA